MGYYDYEDAAADVRGVACMLNRMATCEGGGAWAHDDNMYALMGRVLLEAVDALEAAADKASEALHIDLDALEDRRA